jgi:hypothetical protein
MAYREDNIRKEFCLLDPQLELLFVYREETLGKTHVSWTSSDLLVAYREDNISS